MKTFKLNCYSDCKNKGEKIQETSQVFKLFRPHKDIPPCSQSLHSIIISSGAKTTNNFYRFSKIASQRKLTYSSKLSHTLKNTDIFIGTCTLCRYLYVPRSRKNFYPSTINLRRRKIFKSLYTTLGIN